MFQPARPSDRWSRVANCLATSNGSLNVVLMVPASPRRSVTPASAASTVNVSGRPTTSRSWMRPRCSRSRRPSARKKKSNRPRSAVRARWTNESNSIWLPESWSDPHRGVVDPGEVCGQVNRLAPAAFPNCGHPVSPQRLAISSCERSRSAWRWVTEVMTSSSAAVARCRVSSWSATSSAIAHELRCRAVLHHGELLVGQRIDGVGVRVGNGPVAGADRVHPVAVAGRQTLGGVGVVGHYDIGGHHDVGLGQRGRRLELVAVYLDRVQGGGRGDVVARDERQAAGAGDLRALALAAAEDPRRQAGPLARRGVCVDAVDLVAAVDHGQDVAYLLGEVGGDGFGLLQHRHAWRADAGCASARSCRTAAGRRRRRRRAIPSAVRASA